MTQPLSHLKDDTGTLSAGPSVRRTGMPHAPTIVVIEDHPLYRAALVELVHRATDGQQAVSAASSAEEGLAMCAANPQVQLVLVDIHLPGMSGLEAIGQLKQMLPNGVVVVLTASDHRRDVDAAIRRGAHAFASKTLAPSLFADLIRRVMKRPPAKCEVMLGPVPSSMSPDRPIVGLSARQQQVLALVAEGQSNKEIGWRLSLAEITVKQHVSSILRSLKVGNRTHAVTTARRLGLGIGTGDNQSPL